MTSFQLSSLLVGLAALFGYVNHRTLRLPGTIGLLFLAIVASLVALALDRAVPALHIRQLASAILKREGLPQAFLDGVLAFLLFAGALHVDLPALLRRKWTILALATGGVILATGLMGGAMYFVFTATRSDIPLIWCLLLGAVVAPTDPVAVLAILRRVGMRPSLRAVIVGESLFNDGVGVVIFGMLVAVLTQGTGAVSGAGIAAKFLLEAGGGAALGLASGYVAFFAMRSIDKYDLELMISIALAMITYSLADWLGMSGPIAVVMAGLITGHHGTRFAMSDTTRRNLETFWSVVDEVLNALLFLLIGLKLLTLDLDAALMLPCAIAVALSPLVRAMSIVPGFALHLHAAHKLSILAVMTWSGIRGGISIALVLTLPDQPERIPIVAVCYAIVVFTILAQGLTLGRVARWAFPGGGRAAEAEEDRSG